MSNLPLISEGYEFKCRRCGEVFSSLAGGFAEDIIRTVLRDGKWDAGWDLRMHRVHYCKDPEGLGVADFIGAKCRELTDG